MDLSAVVLAGGSSSRIGEDKSLLELAGKPLLIHVIDAVRTSVDEVIVVTSSQRRIEEYSALTGGKVKYALDEIRQSSPLIGALSGFNVALSKYSLLLPSDTPFISGEVVSFLFQLCIEKSAVIPRWPNGQIEPLHAVYETAVAVRAAKAAISEGRLDMRGMIEKMHGVRYVSTIVLQQLDPKLRLFFNVNTRSDMKAALEMIGQQKMT